MNKKEKSVSIEEAKRRLKKWTIQKEVIKMEKPNKLMYRTFALATGVVVVAVEGAIKDWSAYIGKTEGNNHYKESFEVAKHGAKLPYNVAKVLFPKMDELFKWRY